MDYSLVLSHLPPHLAQCAPLRERIKQLRTRPPCPSEVLDALRMRRQIRETETHFPVIKEDKAIVAEALTAAEATIKTLERLKLRYASFWSTAYPSVLRSLAYPPWCIFYSGNLPMACATLAIVGTRKPDSYGTRLVAQWVPELQTRPLQIVSGLAYGIDSHAHHYACESGIANFAVLGSGPDVLYPSAHAELAERILATGGGILSEYPPGTQPHARHFPWRNRIISGLSAAVWVVQGTLKSGSLHTVEHSFGQSRALIAAPGNVFSELSAITNRLIFDGGTCALRAADIDKALQEAWVNLAPSWNTPFDN